MDFIKSLATAASGLHAQAGRMRVISENIANADSTGQTPGAAAYRRKIPTFRTEVDRVLDADVVALGRVRTDPSSFRKVYEPGHPAADANGYVNGAWPGAVDWRGFGPHDPADRLRPAGRR